MRNEDPPGGTDEINASDEDIPNFPIEGEGFETDSSGNSEDEEPLPVELGGYELLPIQDPELQGITITTRYSVNVEFADFSNAFNGADVDNAQGDSLDLSTVKEIENDVIIEEKPSIPEPEMDDERIAKIKAAMANISLPPTAIPSWANVVPEDRWKSDLIAKIQNVKI